MGAPTPRSVAFDRIAERYDETRGGIERGTRAAGFVQPWLSTGGPIVEIGVGTGAVAAPLAEALGDAGAPPIYGVDLSLPMLARARQRLGERVVAGDAERLPLREASVATVYFVHVLHLVADLDSVLAETHRVLRPGGRVLVICTDPKPPADDDEAMIAGLQQQLSGQRSDDPDRVVGVAARQGLALVHRERLDFPARWSISEVIRAIDERVWSWTWDVDPETWMATVKPVLDHLTSLPDHDQLREVTDARTLLVFAPESTT